ncbi:MAG: peptidyl-tRNA hydrolase, partial [Actinomyces oris]
WADDGYRVRVVVPSREQWETITRPVSVTDAGFTELDGPTETTRAFW